MPRSCHLCDPAAMDSMHTFTHPYALANKLTIPLVSKLIRDARVSHMIHRRPKTYPDMTLISFQSANQSNIETLST
jgi:hypothetical protein